MSRVLRIVLLWLVAFALPVQGVVAATMVFCGPAHERSAAHDHAAHDPAAHDHSAEGHHVGHDAGTAADPEGTGCSVCASCCTSAALPSLPMAHDSPRGHAVFQSTLTPSTATFLTSGPDRPPRSILD